MLANALFWFVSGLVRQKNGALAVTMALAMTVLVGFAGVAIDVAFWQTTLRQEQNAADQAVYSAVIAAKAGQNATTNARGVATQMGFANARNGVTVAVNNPPTQGSEAGNSQAWEVIIKKPQPMWFSRMFLASAPVAAARAVAYPGVKTSYCILVLDPSASGALSLTGSTGITTPSCSIMVNSQSASGATLNGTSLITSSYLSLVGTPGYSKNSNSTISATIDSGMPAISDPYASVSVPNISGMTCHSAVSVGNRMTLTIPPGRYCGGISVSQGGTLLFGGGTYYIDGGQISVNAGTVTSLLPVTLILTSSTGSNYATISFTGGSTVNLTAQNSGTFSGLVIFQDRNAPTSTSNTLTGGAGQNFIGDLYFPNTALSYAGGASTTSCTHLIVRDLTFVGNSNFQDSCSGVGNREIVGMAVNMAE